MARKAGNFIMTFTDHYHSGYVPRKFYIWSAISLIGAALERRVWLPWYGGNVYPNMYVFLVAGPGEGKSTAIRPAVKILKKCNELHHTFIRLLPNQVTEARMLDILGEQNFFTYKKKQYNHSSAFLVASEASTTLKGSEEHSIVKALTALYDKDDFHKETVSRTEPVHIVNPCINLLAGTTFHDLNQFLNKQGILGGFASRCTFVVHNKSMRRTSEWFDEENHIEESIKMKGELVDDLGVIAKMVGGFKATPEVKDAWNEWWPIYDKKRCEIENEILKAFMVRKMTALQKLVQILCVSDGDDMVIKLSHWNMALKLIDEVEADVPAMLRQGQSTDTRSNEGIKAAIIQELINKPGHHDRLSLLSTLTLLGHTGNNVATAVVNLTGAGGIVKKDAYGKFVLAVDPNIHL